ncbi:MAG: hypothetical protein V4551_16475 [Pseudomonadota bacterium]
MSMPALTPETMTAADRRRAWFENDPPNLAESLRDFDHELLEVLRDTLQTVELLRGESAAAGPLLDLISGGTDRAETWRDAIRAPSLSLLDAEWVGAVFLDHAGLYGLYGVTPEEISFGERDLWLAKLGLGLLDWESIAQRRPDSRVALILKLARSRYVLDKDISPENACREEEEYSTLDDAVDVEALAIFGGVTEGRIRNILSSGDGGLEKVGQRVTAVSAAAWLKGRKEFFASIWQQPDEVVPEAPSPDFSDEVVFVPVAADGSHFHPGLARGGKFMIGAKGEEVQYGSFDEALSTLQKMATPRWRRPNEAGNWGIVSGRDWKRIERRQLMSM